MASMRRRLNSPPVELREPAGAAGCTPKPRAPRRYPCARPKTTLLRLVDKKRRRGGFESSFAGPDGVLYVRVYIFTGAEESWFRLGSCKAGVAG